MFIRIKFLYIMRGVYMLIGFILGIIFSFIVLTLYSCLVVSSQCSREEERLQFEKDLKEFQSKETNQLHE